MERRETSLKKRLDMLQNDPIADIAFIAGVSRSVVSRVVNRKVEFTRKRDGRTVRVCSEELELKVRKIAIRYAKIHEKAKNSLQSVGAN